MIDAKHQYQLRKFINELKGIRGRHTELVSVYVPVGYDIVKIQQHLAQEQGTAVNIKDKTNRLSVQTSLEKMIRHLKLYTKTPPNGLAAFSGNVSTQEGKSDIKVWSIEPPLPLGIRMYRCDQTFVLEPLIEMMVDKDTYGLLVMDNREATLALLRGKTIQVIRTFGSNVPGKLQVGGWCLDPYTTILMKDYTSELQHLKIGDELKSYDFKNKKQIISKCTKIWKSKKKRLSILFGGFGFFYKGQIFSSEDHLFFVYDKNNKIKQLSASKLKVGDLLLDYNMKKVKIRKIFKPNEKTQIMEMIDIETEHGNFFANGILVHNSQQRYARLREEAEHEFYKRIADVLNPELLAIKKDLRGILIGGPGPTKEKFANGSYINTELKDKLLGTKDIAYTDESGLHELLDKSQDILAEAGLVKEKQAVNEILTMLAKNSEKVAYGYNDVKKALDYGAVDKIMISEACEKIEELEEKASKMGTEIIIVSLETKEGIQLKDLGGVAAILRYKVE